MAEANKNDVATQLRETASMPNSFPIAGKAMLTEDPMKGITNAAKVAMMRVTF